MLIMSLAKEHNISISALCKRFKMPRSSYYYIVRRNSQNAILSPLITKIFKNNYKSYGTRKIKFELSKLGYQVSREKIGQIMKDENLVSNYTSSSFRPQSTKSVNSDHPNIVQGEFDDREVREVMVTDTTYFLLNNKWHYLCVIVDLCGRNIDGFFADSTKDATLTKRAILSIKCDLRDIGIFHSDRGSEFLNKLVDKMLRAFDIRRSASRKGNPYDNAVAESMFKIIKTEFIKGRSFNSLEEFNQEFSKWVDWYNNVRIHGSLGYQTPSEYRNSQREKKNATFYGKCEAF